MISISLLSSYRQPDPDPGGGVVDSPLNRPPQTRTLSLWIDPSVSFPCYPSNMFCLQEVCTASPSPWLCHFWPSPPPPMRSWNSAVPRWRMLTRSASTDSATSTPSLKPTWVISHPLAKQCILSRSWTSCLPALIVDRPSDRCGIALRSATTTSLAARRRESPESASSTVPPRTESQPSTSTTCSAPRTSTRSATASTSIWRRTHHSTRSNKRPLPNNFPFEYFETCIIE